MKTATHLATRLNGSRSAMQQFTKATYKQGLNRALHVPVVAAAPTDKNEDKQKSLQVNTPVAAGLVLGSSLSAGAAHAQDASTVDSAVNAIIDIVKAAGDATKASISAAQTGVEAAQQAYEQVAPAVKQAVDVTVPVLKGAVDAATPVVTAGVKAASSVAKPGLEKALSSAGFETASVSKTAGQAVDTAKPLVESLVHFLTTSSPTTLAEVALGLVASYYLLPPALNLAAGALRGYAGDVSAAAALDALSSRGNAVLLDIRTAREKEQGGSPDLPNSGKLVELEYATIEDRRIRGQLRNIGDLEIKITALQIAALKKLNKGSAIYVMDRNGSTAKAVAREISRRGFGKVYVVKGGFQGWNSAKLGTKLSNVVSRVEVLLPGSFKQGSVSSTTSNPRRQIAAGTSKSVKQIAAAPSRRALPSSTGQ